MRKPVYEREGITLYHGDMREVLPELELQAHAVITDPPYGLSFMGKGWDHSVPGEAFWRIIADAMKPGAHLLSFGGSRTYHRMGVAIEDAGLELRDTLMWLYGSGFPKSHDVSKAIDKAAGAGREVVGSKVGLPGYRSGQTGNNDVYGSGLANGDAKSMITAPATPEAAQWQGWGTALKPAHEPIILARKPLCGTVAANVLAHGTGALNIDASRIPGGMDDTPESWAKKGAGGKPGANGYAGQFSQGMKDAYARGDIPLPAGRWPANVILDEDAAAALDAQSGERKSGGCMHDRSIVRGVDYGQFTPGQNVRRPPDTGGASRFFYVAKASRKERNAGLDGMPEQFRGTLQGDSTPRNERDGKTRNGTAMANVHPTVKPLALMRYLITLITPPGGIVLDPFAGSGTTGVACAELGFPCVLIEQEEEYLPIIMGRLDHELDERDRVAKELRQGVLV